MKSKKQYYKEINECNTAVHNIIKIRDQLIKDCQKEHSMTYKQIEKDYNL